MMGSGRKPIVTETAYQKWSDYEMQFEEYALSQPHVVPFPMKKPRGTVH
jgi:hypothetical protein